MQRAFRAGDLVILAVAAVLMVLLGAASYLVAPPAGNDLRASTYSTRGDGAKAAFLLLKELGYPVERSFEPMSVLRADPAKTILVLASPAGRASAQDTRAMRTFLERGGIVVATGAGATFLPDMRSVVVRHVGVGDPTRYRAVVKSALTREARELRIESEIYGLPSTSSSYVPVYLRASADSNDGDADTDPNAPGVLAARIGEGRVLWWIGSTPLLNHDINTSGHLELLLNTLGPPGGRTILWDEYYHGYDRGLLSYLASTHLPTAFAQLALIAAAAIFTFSRRRGPIRSLVVAPRASAMEFVDAMAALYQKARATSGAVETTRARVRRLLITAAQMPASSSDEQLATATAARYPIQERELLDVLTASADAAGTASLRVDEALALVQRLQAIAAIVHERR
jgi:hypothetical protein